MVGRGETSAHNMFKTVCVTPCADRPDPRWHQAEYECRGLCLKRTATSLNAPRRVCGRFTSGRCVASIGWVLAMARTRETGCPTGWAPKSATGGLGFGQCPSRHRPPPQRSAAGRCAFMPGACARRRWRIARPAKRDWRSCFLPPELRCTAVAARSPIGSDSLLADRPGSDR